MVFRNRGIPWLPAAFWRLRHDLRIAGSRHGLARLDVYDLACRAGGRRVQRAAVPACHAGEGINCHQFHQSVVVGSLWKTVSGASFRRISRTNVPIEEEIETS